MSIANASSQDEGKITSFYSDIHGTVAFLLDSGFVNGKSIECPQTNGFAALNPNAPDVLKSLVLAAKSSNQTVVVVTDGCHANGVWLKIHSIYIK